MGFDFLKNGKMHASLGCCVAETTVTFRTGRRISAEEFRREYLGPQVVYARELGENDGALLPEQWREFEKEGKPGRGKSGRAAYDAVWIKKRRLKKTAMTIACLHGGRARWVTVTTRHGLKVKKDFLYAWENVRKDLARGGFALGYSGMLERQDGKRREDGIGRMVWHFHCLAYLQNGADWDYSRMQRIAMGRGFNIDMRKLGKAGRPAKKIAGYMAKLDAAVVAAYAAKMESGEDYCYTCTSKGCDLPKTKTFCDAREALELIEGYGFRKQRIEKNGMELFYYLLENEHFGREIYDSC